MIATMPALAVTTLLQERATATARCPTRTGGVRVPRGCDAEAWRSQDGQARGRIPADELRIDRLTVVPPDAQRLIATDRPHHGQHGVVVQRDPARRAPSSLHLHDRWGRTVHEC